MIPLTQRQNLILDFLRQNPHGSNRTIKQYVEEKVGELNRITIVRDLDELLKQGLITKEGEGRSISYRLTNSSPLLVPVNVKEYFELSSDRRVAQKQFNFDVFDYFTTSLFSSEELARLDEINQGYREHFRKLSPTLLKREFERLTIELSWKSSQIEGNTYSLIDTEILITEHKEAVGHTKEEAQMILNHKRALDYILGNPKDFKKLTLPKIQSLHSLVVEDLGITPNLRKRPVGITGTVFRPLDNEFQIKEALDRMMVITNDDRVHPLAKSLAAILLVSYIQPFEDGNKRTARLLGNAILLAADYCPLSYRSVEVSDYKKAILLFYEQSSALFFKELFVQQFRFAATNYFLA